MTYSVSKLDALGTDNLLAALRKPAVLWNSGLCEMHLEQGSRGNGQSSTPCVVDTCALSWGEGPSLDQESLVVLGIPALGCKWDLNVLRSCSCRTEELRSRVLTA